MKKNFLLLSLFLPLMANAETHFRFNGVVDGDNVVVSVSLDKSFTEVSGMELTVTVSDGTFVLNKTTTTSAYECSWNAGDYHFYFNEPNAELIPTETSLFTLTYPKEATLNLSDIYFNDVEGGAIEISYEEVEINNLTLGMNGYSTYGSKVYAVEFVGAEAYSVVVDGSKAVSTTIDNNVVAQGTGALLKGTEGDLVLCVQSYETSAATSNELKVADGTYLSDVYVFATKSQGSAFYKYSGTVPVGKAYLEATAGARLDLDLEDETGIDSIELEQSDAIFNLQGNKLEKAEKGISIVNGKKVMF